MQQDILLLGAGLLAGATNAVAGGGTFVTLPALIVAGLSPISANVSSTVALFPGSLAGAWAYRQDKFGSLADVSLRAMLLVSIVGGVSGALLLLRTPLTVFRQVIPWLVLLGTLAFAFGPRLGVALRRRFTITPRLGLLSQLLLSIYGGYFGGAVGILMLAVWGLLGSTDDLKALNATKNLLVGVTNGAAVSCFIFTGSVSWRATSVVLVASVVGGYAGARLTRRVPTHRLRQGIIGLNALITSLFFYKMLAG